MPPVGWIIRCWWRHDALDRCAAFASDCDLASSATKRALSLLLLHFSILSEQTEYGPRSFPLDKVEQLPEVMKELVLRLITSLPVSQFLKS